MTLKWISINPVAARKHAEQALKDIAAAQQSKQAVVASLRTGDVIELRYQDLIYGEHEAWIFCERIGSGILVKAPFGEPQLVNIDRLTIRLLERAS